MTVYQQASPIPNASPPGTPGWRPSDTVAKMGQGGGQRIPATWYVTPTGNDLNGGTSLAVLASGTTGFKGTAAGQNSNTFSDANANFTQVLVGHGICMQNSNPTQSLQIVARIMAVIDAHTILLYPPPAFGASGFYNFNSAAANITYTIGGAWASLTRAVNGWVCGNWPVTSGDTVYMGGGTYRETPTTQSSNTQGSNLTYLSIIGDLDGSRTGFPGEVIITNATINDRTLGYGSALIGTITLAPVVNNIFLANLTIMSTNGFAIQTSGGCAGVTILNCNLIAHNAQGGNQAVVAIGAPTVSGVAVPLMWTIIGCNIFGSSTGLNIGGANPANSNIDNGVVIINCRITAGVNAAAISIATSGIRVYNCTITGAQGVATVAGQTSSAIPCEIHNCIVMAGTVCLSAAAPGQIVESYNVLLFNGTAAAARANINAGVGTIADHSYDPLMSIGQEYQRGLPSPPYLTPLPGSPLLGFGAQPAAPPGVAGLVTGYNGAATAYPNAAQFGTLGPPAVDMLNRVRPSGGGSPLPAVGALERHDFAVQDNVTFLISAPSAALVGPGDDEIRIPVDAVPNTIALSIRYDASYAGTPLPQIQLVANGEIGVQGQTQTVVGASGTWLTTTLSAFTPTAPGWVVLRIISYDTSGISRVNFAQLTVT